VLQEQAFERIGGIETVRTDVRVIAASHRDLRALAAEGKFRADLYYRLAICTIELPPLRARADDVPILARHFLHRYNRELGKDVREISEQAMARLHAYAWPGNVRDLQSVLKQALLRASGNVLVPAFLPDLAAEPSPAPSPAVDLDLGALVDRLLSPEAANLYADVHREVDRRLLSRVLDYTKGNHRHAARLLGIARQTMRAKVRAVGLRVSQAVTDDSDDDDGGD